ncbi:MAG: hypothetical protein LBT71_03090 [Azoarcus sp.]|nr:hypothetical protein [Azoarcus sp.]
MRPSIFLFLLAVLALPANAGQPGVARVFSCEINGRPVFGDTLPKECYGHAWVEKVNGVTIYREVAQPTAAESASRRERARQQEMTTREAARQRRQDDALRERYLSLADLDARRDYEVAQFDEAIAELRATERDLTMRRKSLDSEVEALKGKPLPEGLASAIAYADEELSRARAAIEKKVKERDDLRQRFDADRSRYIDLTSTPRAAN